MIGDLRVRSFLAIHSRCTTETIAVDKSRDFS